LEIGPLEDVVVIVRLAVVFLQSEKMKTRKAAILGGCVQIRFVTGLCSRPERLNTGRPWCQLLGDAKLSFFTQTLD